MPETKTTEEYEKEIEKLGSQIWDLNTKVDDLEREKKDLVEKVASLSKPPFISVPLDPLKELKRRAKHDFDTSGESVTLIPADPTCAWAVQRIDFLERRVKELEDSLTSVLDYAETEAIQLHEMKDCPEAEEEADNATVECEKARAVLQGSPKLENTPPLPAAGPTA